MNHHPMETAPKDRYCLGYDPCLKRPIVMRWSKKKGKFVVVNGMGDETPTSWSPLPPLEDWLPLETAPKDTCCLGYDPEQNRPFEMLWNIAEQTFVEHAGMDDVNPTLWLPLPEMPDTRLAA